jgi:flagellar protein FliS
MSEASLYKEYTDDNVLNSNPLGLVVALYQGAIDNIAVARNCLAERDIPGRTKAINKAYSIISELIISLDKEKGGDFGENLAALYAYMQSRLLNAQMKQKAEPLEEVQKLLTTILDGWKEASLSYDPLAAFNAAASTQSVAAAWAREQNVASSDSMPYGGYLADYGDIGTRQAYSF